MTQEAINIVLVSDDGNFHCVPELAVDLAYMLSDLESYLGDYPDSDLEWEIGSLIIDYLKGRKTPQEVQEVIREWRKEDSE